MGWCCAEPTDGALLVHWIYVVHIVRKQGVARGLLELLTQQTHGRGLDAVPLVATQWPAHPWIGQKLPNLAYDPYLVAEAS